MTKKHKMMQENLKGYQTDLRHHENISEGKLLLLGQREESEGAVSGGACAKA